MTSLYQMKEGQPFHISVGGVVVNDAGEILVHKRMKSRAPEQFADNFVNNKDDIYLLCRESLENGETLEEAILRGIHEEFGATGSVVQYLGTVSVSIVVSRYGRVEKTTPYFLIRLGSQGERMMDDEGFSVLEWHTPDFLMEHMRGQGGADRSDLDEHKIIEAYVATR